PETLQAYWEKEPHGNFQINIYPAGEGAGYAGGITSSALDGMNVAQAVIKRIKDRSLRSLQDKG
ncbi:MAG: hypothetical protein ACI4UO_02835, partial [Paludibacteraceae bacterium]